MIKDLNKLARKIVETNQYLTMATSDKNGSPWTAAVVYSYDKDWNFYFVSIPSSKHCQNIENNKRVVVAIFDSHQLFGEGVGLQIEGEAIMVDIKDTPKVATIYFGRIYPYGKVTHNAGQYIKRFMKKGELYRFYKIRPTKFWMNDPNSKIDLRVGVKP
ncbi:hypothetical protein A2115_00345 [Candidatus Woesebacteria bacterium GWA1_41_8]|uniref:Pyridoxamine 5'-phosphate oxidase N-terminal domain-containing protein n=1 Tax=Candidatus Woesebacteria bacterium GWA1_41_8 TaxID=1802471 RepID=A0A1F7WIJ3_9BACT|nr:MAG: hypothetical protein A2115_00345 [Candidatus Woesebacteria bacterium GWA1_41_8]